MMRQLFVIGTALFWLAVGGIWLGSRLAVPAPVPAPPPVPAAERRIPLAEVARHATPDNCWMAIDGAVYDITTYLPDHPSKPAFIEPWCGREASQAYRTKTKGRPHSAEADRLLPTYRIGLVAKQ